MNISIIIPTINRSHDLARCLDCLLQQKKLPHQLIIIDHSEDHLTKQLIQKEAYQSINILYHRSAINSGAQARNRGIEHLDKKTDIVVFIDDDTSFDTEFLFEIETFFLENKQANGGVAHITSPVRTIWIAKKIGFFLLTWWCQRDKQFVTRGWFNALPFIQWETIQPVERTSGCAMFFRKSILDEWFRFPQKFLKYSLMEDCFLSYAIYCKYPESIYYVPTVHLIHHESPAWRIANRAKIMQNIIHRYLFVRQFRLSLIGYLRTTLLLWILDLMSYKSLTVIRWYIQGLFYVFSQKNSIEKDTFEYNRFIFDK